MKLNSIFFILALCISCSSIKPINEKPKPVKKRISKATKIKKTLAALATMNIQIPLGQTKLVRLNIPKIIDVEMINCENVGSLHFIQDEKEITFFVPIPYKIDVKSFNCHLNVKNHKIDKHLLAVEILPVEYPKKMLNVAKRHVELSPKNVKRWLKEKKKQEEIYSSPHPLLQFNEPFAGPLNSKITSFYGYKRVFNNKKDSWHSGTDFRAPIGTKIPATNRGIVRYAGDLFFNGGTVILDHGMGIFTMYCHLSKLLVSEGEVVPKGQIIALSGNTGRSTGPHLHWGVKVNGHWVDSKSIISESTILFSQNKND